MLVRTVISLYHAGGFAGSLAVGTEAELNVYRARRRRPVAAQEKTKKVKRLAYSTTSSSAEHQAIGPRGTSERARQPEIV